MNEPYIVVHTQYYTVHWGYMMMHGEKNGLLGEGKWGKRGDGERKRETNKRAEAGREKDSKPITMEKAFHPKTVTTHANIHTSIFFFPLLPLLHTNTVSTHTHMVRHLSLSLTHTHIQSSLQTNALLIKY